MSWKYVPYAGFLLFALLVSVVRYIFTPDISWASHAIWLIAQYCLLVCIWLVIKTVSRFLDKRVAYNQSFSRRVFLQIVLSLILIVPAVSVIYVLVKPSLPGFFSTQFIALSWILLFVVVVLMNTGFAAGLFFSGWQRTAEEKAKAEVELVTIKQRQAEIEMKALRAQMNPHFIFNSLNSINKYILRSDHENASKYLARFAKLIRLILDNSNSREVALSDEVEALKLYIEMEALRFTNKFSYEILVAQNVEMDSIQVPPLIFQPYVENAIWHGLLHKSSGGKLFVHL